MRPRVSSRARSRPDRGGDPLDGLVNLFDLGVVLSVAFLLAALSSLKLADLVTNQGVAVLRGGGPGAVTAKPGERVRTIKLGGRRVVGSGTRVGSVFRLADGRIVYVQGR